ncbi:MAG: cell division protein FtsQ/DivIB [Wenyingzhuangia sp.]|uniref:cell division protein FtsQ/DivIB n=1 Tax=Wenyingzhuangia sp. TaxID=1964193 RepID=UPI00321A91E9
MRKVKEVEVVFADTDPLFLTHQMVNNLLIQKGRTVVNQSKSLINLQELEQRVETHPMIQRVEVSLGVVGDFRVSVVQRKPFAREYNKQGVFYIDSEGKKMPMSEVYSARVPILNNQNGYINTDEVFPLVQRIHDDMFLRKLVVTIKKDEQGYWLQTRFNHQQVLFGELINTAQKIKKLKVFYNYMENDSLSATFKKIDLQYNNQVVCSK